MKAFRILLALVTAGATFYGLNLLAVQYGYHDRLDFKNKHYHEQNCDTEKHRSQVFIHDNGKMIEPMRNAMVSANKVNR